MKTLQDIVYDDLINAWERQYDTRYIPKHFEVNDKGDACSYCGHDNCACDYFFELERDDHGE